MPPLFGAILHSVRSLSRMASKRTGTGSVGRALVVAKADKSSVTEGVVRKQSAIRGQIIRRPSGALALTETEFRWQLCHGAGHENPYLADCSVADRGMHIDATH